MESNTMCIRVVGGYFGLFTLGDGFQMNTWDP